MSTSASKKVIYAALAGNGLIALTKFIAALITGSSAMLAEGIHSVVDTGNQILLLFGMHQSRKPPNERFPFGRGKEVYFWSFVVAIMIFAVGAGISIYEGIIHLASPQPVHASYVNFIVIALAMIFEGSAWLFALREFSRAKGKWNYIEAVQRGKDPSMFIVLFEDSAALIGLVVAFLGILISQLTGNSYWDAGASIVIGLILGGTAAWLAYETKRLLIGESANVEVVRGIRAILEKCCEIDHINEILTMHIGPEYILVNISVDFKDPATAVEVETSIAAMDKRIKQAWPRVKRIFIEAESRMGFGEGGPADCGPDPQHDGADSA